MRPYWHSRGFNGREFTRPPRLSIDGVSGNQRRRASFWFGVWVGSTLGMVAADALAIVVAHALGRN